MDRLAKKCVIVSGIVHGTLMLVLIIGPAFLGSNEKAIDPKEFIDFIPYKTIDQSLTGGGSPNVPNVIPQPDPPKHEPTPPKDQPKAEPPKDPTPVIKDEPKQNVRDPNAFVPTPPKQNKIVLTPKTPTAINKDNAKAQAKKLRDAEDARKKEIASNLDSTLNNIRIGTAGGVKIQELRGPGGGGIPYAGFNQALASTYMRNWIAPSDSADSSEKVIAAITLSKDGKVISSRITKPSGNADLNKSVQDALNKVSYVAPFPDSEKDAEKTFHLEFDPKAKRMMG